MTTHQEIENDITKTQKAQAALAELATQVKSNYESLDIVEVLNRIHYITGRPFPKVIEGYKFLTKLNLISPEFVLNAHKLPAIERTVNKVFPLIDAMDAVIVSAEALPPKETTRAEIIHATAMPDGPTDDDDVEEILTHINANF